MISFLSGLDGEIIECMTLFCFSPHLIRHLILNEVVGHFFQLRASPIGSLKSILDNKHTKNSLQQLLQKQNFSNFLFFYFFWSCYSRSFYLEKIVATPNEFFYLKKSYNSIKNRERSGRRGEVEPSNPSILSLSTSFSVSYHRES